MNRKSLFFIFIIFICLFLTSFSGCLFSRPIGRLSGPVLFVHSSPAMQDWLDQPNQSYIQAYFLFPDDFASDIIFGIDQEFIEGVNDSIHFKGADWMALVGLTREGILNIPIGTNDSLNGTPSDASVWKTIDLGVTLEPNTWYFIKEVADFNQLRFNSFTLIGPDINITIDLSDYFVDYPNYIPIDDRSMTYYVFAVRTYHYKEEGSTIIYFEDVEAGIRTPDGFEPVLSNGFESQQYIPDLPITLPVTPLKDITEHYWYKENDLALLNVTSAVSRSGSYSCSCDVTFEGMKAKQSFPFQFRRQLSKRNSFNQA